MRITEIHAERCPKHGGRLVTTTLLEHPLCPTDLALAEVEAERLRQFARYGTNEGLADGTGPGVRWALTEEAADVEHEFRLDYESHERQHGAPTWMHLVREEVAEAFLETDPARLRAELIQVAALCVSWVEKLDTRDN